MKLERSSKTQRRILLEGNLCWVAGVMGEFVTWYDFTSETAGMQCAA